ncbi:Oidioi.mRNA.OKI2018_I69.PAR.g9752.t1.cds [Oikopleura dioica]|uniref:Oidioi.mRNA.OKI2018_I69.PAR.g9752.t1.cds n=1 Tax=Oikopleura dioica TaxID=34765 RepID=A0ABN7RRH3_OIKDI|nr:Oidioi.mRNA.OKI2018_I69.PAR.g9752.t1.cds [Oikopleura dioica]
MAGSIATPEAPVHPTPPKAGDYLPQPSVPLAGAPEPPPQQQHAYPTEQPLPLDAHFSGISETLSYSTSSSMTSYSSDLPSNSRRRKQMDDDVLMDYILRCFCCSIVLFLTLVFVGWILWGDNEHHYDGGPPLGSPQNPFVFASSFVDQGSIDNQTVNICDGNFEYDVSSFGHFQ